MNDLHDRSSSSKSDDERQRTIIVHRTIYKLRVATKLIKSMRLTEASSLLVLRIDLIGLLPLPSLPPLETSLETINVHQLNHSELVAGATSF